MWLFRDSSVDRNWLLMNPSLVMGLLWKNVVVTTGSGTCIAVVKKSVAVSGSVAQSPSTCVCLSFTSLWVCELRLGHAPIAAKIENQKSQLCHLTIKHVSPSGQKNARSYIYRLISWMPFMTCCIPLPPPPPFSHSWNAASPPPPILQDEIFSLHKVVSLLNSFTNSASQKSRVYYKNMWPMFIRCLYKNYEQHFIIVLMLRYYL